MLAFLPHWLRGSLSLLLIALSTLFWFIPLILLAFIKLLVPIHGVRALCTRLLIEIATLWIGFNNRLLDAMNRIEWDVSGLDQLRPDDWYLVTCNHQSWADILVVQKVLHRRTPMLKFFLKQQLIWVPVIGVAWWALDFPFMKRYSKAELEKTPSLKGKDLETTRKACEKFAYFPTSVMNFFEGTRFDAQKHAKQGSPYKHLLKPKAGGAAFTLNAMSGHLRNLLDVTIIYPPGTPRSLMAFLGGAMDEVEIVVQQRVIPAWASEGNYEDDAEFRARFQQWIGELWADKDALLDKKNATRNTQHGTR